MVLISTSLAAYLIWRKSRIETQIESDLQDRVLLTEKSSSHPYSHTHVGERWREIQGGNNWQEFCTGGDGEIVLDDMLREEICRVGDFAQACYDGFENSELKDVRGTCKYAQEKFFDEVALNDRGYEVTHYLYTVENLEGRDRRTWIGYVARCTSENESRRLGRWDILVALRGTQTMHEWIENVKICLVVPPWEVWRSRGWRLGSLNLVHQGFCNLFENFADALKNAVFKNLREFKKEGRENVSITFCGHSLGSALAILGARTMAKAMDESKFEDKPSSRDRTKMFAGRRVPITVFSFAGPMVGNRGFKTELEELGVPVLRLITKSDIVPKLPMELLPGLQFVRDGIGFMCYEHVGQPLTIHLGLSPYLKYEALEQVPLLNAHHLLVMLHVVDGHPGRNGEFRPRLRDYALVNRYGDYLKNCLKIKSAWGRSEELMKKYFRKNASASMAQNPPEELFQREPLPSKYEVVDSDQNELCSVLNSNSDTKPWVVDRVSTAMQASWNSLFPVETLIQTFDTFVEHATDDQIVARLSEISSHVEESTIYIRQSIVEQVEDDLNRI